VLARLAPTRAKAKIPRLEQALDGTGSFTSKHARLLKAMLRRIDSLDADIAQVSRVVEELLAPWEEQLQQAESMPGWQRRAAQDVLAETGPDMGRFPTPAHLVSWAGRAPLDHQSGQRKGRGRRKKGNRYIGAATGETSVSAGRTQTREGARYRRLARRIGKDKAQVAVSNTQLTVYHKLLSNPGARYQDLGADYYDKHAQARRKIKHHLAELDALGYDVIITPRPGQDDEGTGQTPAA
jgi:transposase